MIYSSKALIQSTTSLFCNTLHPTKCHYAPLGAARVI